MEHLNTANSWASLIEFYPILNLYNFNVDATVLKRSFMTRFCSTPSKSRTMGLYYNLVLAGLLLAVQIIYSTAFVQGQNYTNFSFPSFSTPESFLLSGTGYYFADNTSFILNDDAAPVHVTTDWECGRLSYKEKVRMKDSASGVVASFHTAFTFQITGDNYSYGDGLVFSFSRDGYAGDDSLAGGSLCLFNAADNGMASNHIFAVEFDTYQNQEFNDPSDNHIGVDINSVNSTWFYNLCGGSLTNCSYLCNAGFFTAWIDYDSESQMLQVFFANGSLYNNISKPQIPLIKASLGFAPPLAEVLDEFMYIGFSSSGSMVPSNFHWIQSWTFTSSGMPEIVPIQPPSQPPSQPPITNPAFNSSLRRKVGIIAGVSVGAVGALLVVFFLVRCGWAWALDMKEANSSPVNENLLPRMFTNEELRAATKNFSRSELLGSGVFGKVYKGTLPSGALVAVKRMRMEFTHVKEKFEAEIANLAQIRHQHLVQLRGWCLEEEQLLLVYDYICNGNLDEWLFQFSERNGQGSLTMNRFDAQSLMLRHRILSDVGAALAFLHDECVPQRLHQNIKSSNVLLDGDWNAYLGDFGVASVIDHQQTESSISFRMAKIMTTSFGYMSPEMSNTGQATKESDVYSFGVLMLEVMCGMRPLTIERGKDVLVDRVWRAHEMRNILQMADSRLEAFRLPSDARDSESHIEIEQQEVSPAGEIELQEVSHGELELQEVSHGELESLNLIQESSIDVPDAETVDKKLIANLLHLGLLCCSTYPQGRPSMRLVSELLQSTEYMEMYLPPLPTCKPEAQIFPGQAQLDDGNIVGVEKLDSYLKLATECLEAVQKMSGSRKFNNEQCGYLAEKLTVVIQGASLFLDRSRAEWHRPCSSVKSTRLAQNFKLLVALAKQTESFVQGSCKYEWIQAAMTLSNVSEYVSSLGFNLELCKIAFCKETVQGPGHCLTSAEVGHINEAEVEAMKVKAARDQETLLQKVTLELHSLEGENRELAIILQQRLCGVGSHPASDDEMDKLFKWVIPGDQVGSGASAKVYKAMWLGTPVAKKTFHGSENSEFLQEVEILSQLCHPNITSMFCYAKCSKRTCSIIMELMDEDLDKLMERRCRDGNDSQSFAILEAVDIMIQIGEGVNYLHSKRIVHRDLKSMNILVKNVEVKRGESVHVQAKVTDFGLSKTKDQSTTYSKQTFNTGTSRWMPPEIIKLTSDSREGGLSKHEKLPKYPFKCDSYSFGMVCYEILTGCIPFPNISNFSTIKRRVMTNGYRPILPANCPPMLKALIKRCWSQEPKKRPKFEAICLELKYLKYLLMTGNDSDLD
ncbi:hypothetical protein KC19_7G035900 [Ceratodon purpureus]|uniref:Protein kinase domain-containing protein n=1 Tax=Ceratodon purpureus TaxID=3225 RepID=A0A8T0H7A3_CERPU|nr:hypothetical protein KC19_7G035900 [Ceratodon purpureus]